MRRLGTIVLLLLALTACGGPSSPTAQDVVDDFATAGLAVPQFRDNSPQNCGSLGCTQLITTDSLSVVQFDDPVAAQRYVDAFDGNAHLNGHIVLQYAAAQTPTEQRPAYEARLAEFLAQQ